MTIELFLSPSAFKFADLSLEGSIPQGRDCPPVFILAESFIATFSFMGGMLAGLAGLLHTQLKIPAL